MNGRDKIPLLLSWEADVIYMIPRNKEKKSSPKYCLEDAAMNKR